MHEYEKKVQIGIKYIFSSGKYKKKEYKKSRVTEIPCFFPAFYREDNVPFTTLVIDGYTLYLSSCESTLLFLL